MQYHTVSLSEIEADKENGVESSVTLIDTRVKINESLRRKNVYVQRLKPFKNHFPGIPFLFFAIFKVVYQIVQLTWCLYVTIPVQMLY